MKIWLQTFSPEFSPPFCSAIHRRLAGRLRFSRPARRISVMKIPEKKSGGETNGKISAPEFLSRAEIRESADKRVDLISKEFSEGFKFLENYPRSITVFGSSQATEKDPYYQKALSLCRRIAGELKYSVITGGGPGIMEAANRGAFEAQGQSVGVTIKLPREQATNNYITDKIALTYFFVRKVCLSFSAEAYVFFPGGFGTLDELFEILTLVQARKIESVPLILVGSEYWRPLETFIHDKLLNNKMIDTGDMSLFTILDDENEILEIIKKAPIRNGVEYNHRA